MLNSNGQRELAYIVAIDEIRPIPGYDRVEHARVGGWWIIVHKDQFKVGDLAIYIEVDSKVPAENPAFAFLEKKHYAVKTIKMCKVYSQGLLMHPDDFGWQVTSDGIVTNNMTLHKGDFVTQQLGITYWVPEDNIRKSASVSNPNSKYQSMTARHPDLFKKPFIKKMMKTQIGRDFLFLLFGRKRDTIPTHFPTKFPYIHKSDEERIENCTFWLNDQSKSWIKTLKVDGTSSTYILERKPFGRYEYYVCSRNIRQLTPDQKTYHDDNVYWNMEYKYHIQDMLKDLLQQHKNWKYVCIQGETAGMGLQGNPHKLNDVYFYGFNFIDSVNGRWNSIDAAELVKDYDIMWVPIIDTDYHLPADLEELKLSADGTCELKGASGLREGYVYRSQDGKDSFKNVSRKYLLKKGE